MNQYSTEQAFDDERDARFASRDMAATLIDTLKLKGFSRFVPPPVPKGCEVWDIFASCRILIQWIPPWAYTVNAGRYVCRVDTLAEQSHDMVGTA